MTDKLHKEQLYFENSFIGYCQKDEAHTPKIEKTISKEFLDACEKDGLIVPLLTEMKVVKEVDEKTKEKPIRYYSPFQIYLVSALISNEVDIKGNLWDGGELWGKEAQERPRYVKWANWSSFHVDSYKNKYEPETMGVNYFRLADDFHNFIRLIHSLEIEKDYAKITENRLRHLTNLPALQYNLEPLKSKEINITSYGLDVGKLKILLRNIGLYATHIDPLEHWFYYAKRHPQWRRDKLKGKASLAQDLYGLCDLIYEIIDILGGEKLPPLLEFIHPDFKPYMMDQAEYASGSDIKSTQSAYKRLREWIDNNQEIINQIASVLKKDKYDQQLLERLDKTEKELEEFEKIYGNSIRQVSSGGFVTIHPEEKLKFTDLDPVTQKTVESMLKQRGNTDTEDYELELKTEITMAIDWRLRDLARDVSGVANDIQNNIWPLINKIEREKEMSVPDAWAEFDRKNDPKAPDHQLKRTQFWRKDLVEFQKPFLDKMKNLKQKQGELGGIGAETRLVFCAVCREKPVKGHHSYNDKQISNEAVCDECFNKASDKVLDATEDEWKKIKYAEWKCDNCGQKTLYKFALGNTISLWSRDKVPVKIELEYGRASLEAKCTKCASINRRAIDWGWQP